MNADDRITLRPMTEADLALFESWLHRPHFARWFLPDSTIEAELESNRAAITGADPTHLLIVRVGDRDVGWAQYYRWADYPQEAAKYDAGPAELGIDYVSCYRRSLATQAGPGRSSAGAPSHASHDELHR